MSDEQPTGRLKFTETDTALHRALISAFMQSYNQFHALTRQSGMEMILSDLVLRARALREIGEVDETYCEAFEAMVRDLDEKMTQVGRAAAATLDFMVKRRGGEGQSLDEWPTEISDEEM